ncbi:MAG TPA: zinc dependent phospholipase C family protein [Candidatus Ozemobacteraceae bacterium]|jgi:hypothetical protein
MPFCHPIRSVSSRFLLLLVFLAAAVQAGAWSYHTHRKIVSDAIAFLPTGFQSRFLPFKDVMMQGATDPDTVVKDFMNHVYHIHSRTGHDSAVRITGLFEQAADQVRRSGPSAEAAYTLGLLAHYVADLNQPLHTGGREADSTESDYHSTFERDVQSRMKLIPVPVPVAGGYRPVTDPAARVIEMAETAGRSYDRIGTAYRGGRGVFDLEDLVRDQYAAAVRHVADFWLGALSRGGLVIPLIPPAPSITASATIPAGVRRPGDAGWSSSQAPSLGTPASMVIQKPGPIDLNTATMEQLVHIPGIGEKRARAIIEARRVRPFSSLRDLALVTYPDSGRKAFNVGLIDRLADFVTVK